MLVFTPQSMHHINLIVSLKKKLIFSLLSGHPSKWLRKIEY